MNDDNAICTILVQVKSKKNALERGFNSSDCFPNVKHFVPANTGNKTSPPKRPIAT